MKNQSIVLFSHPFLLIFFFSSFDVIHDLFSWLASLHVSNKALPVLYLCTVTGNALAPLEQIYCDHTALLLAHGVFLWPWRILCLFSMCVWFFSSKSQKYHSPQPRYSWNLRLEACVVCHQAWREGIWGHKAYWNSAGVPWAEGASLGMVYIHTLYVEQTYLLATLSLLSRGTSWLPPEQNLRMS